MEYLVLQGYTVRSVRGPIKSKRPAEKSGTRTRDSNYQSRQEAEVMAEEMLKVFLEGNEVSNQSLEDEDFLL